MGYVRYGLQTVFGRHISHMSFVVRAGTDIHQRGGGTLVRHITITPLMPALLLCACTAPGSRARSSVPEMPAAIAPVAKGMPANADTLAAMALASARAGDTITAIGHYRRALAIDPGHRSGGPFLTLLYDAGHTAEALSIGERYRREGPRNPVVLFRYGWALGYLWENARADSLFRELARLDRGGTYESWSHGELAYLARARGDMAATIRHVDDAVRARPADQVSRVGVATMLLDAGRAREALPILQREVDADSLARGYGVLPALLLLASAYQEVGDSAAARSALERFRPRLAQLSVGVRLRFLAVAGELETASALANSVRTIGRYGSAEPGDRLYAHLGGVPAFGSLLARSRADVNARRRSLGWPEISRPPR